jgi:quinol monooxygenase YgiN
MVRLNVTLVAASSRNAQDLLEALQYQATGTRLEYGCLGCGAWIGPDATVRYCEDWATENDLRLRVESDRFTSMLAIIEAAADAQVQFDFVHQTRGLDYVIELRAQGSESRRKPPSEPGR